MLTLASLAASDEQPTRILVLEQSTISRSLKEVDLPAGVERSPLLLGESIHRSAIESLQDCDLVTFVPEGVVVANEFLRSERRRFEQAGHLQAALTTGLFGMELDDYARLTEREQPFGTVTRHGRKGRGRNLRYFAPCVFSIATGRGRVGSFETFAKRSTWAVARLYMDSLASNAVAEEIDSLKIGEISNVPDNRDSRRQGAEMCEELYLFGAHFARYRTSSRRDLAYLLVEQVRGFSCGSRPRARLAFVQGVLSSLRAQRLLRRRLRRDIRNLA